MKKITKAIVPVAGMGTRFYPATKAQPKEMLPVWDTPAIERIVDELADAGIKDIIFILSPTKHTIHDHFTQNKDLEEILESRGKKEALRIAKQIPNKANFHFRMQNIPLGDGHAIMQGFDLLPDDESAVICFGDDLVDAPKGENAVTQLLKIHEKHQCPVVLLEEVALEMAPQYGMVKMEDDFITKMVEKPAPKDAPSNLGVVGKFILTPDLRAKLFEQKGDLKKEIRLTAALESLILEEKHVAGCVLKGKRFDTGSKMGWLKSTIHFAGKENAEEMAKICFTWLQENGYNKG